jgi:methionine synthase II (cobalamin-independent)
MLADPGAVRELAESLTEGLKLHVAEVRNRVPGAEIVVQLDEPALPGVLRGSVPTASGFGSLRSVDEPVVRETLAKLVAAMTALGADVAVHCCAPGVPFELLRQAGAKYLSFDASRVDVENARTDEQLGEAIEAGSHLMLGVVPSLEPPNRPAVTGLVRKVLSLTRLGFSPAVIAEHVTITPTCGLAGATPPWARRALMLAHRTADALTDAAA